jgi:hypothetical protein
VLSERRTLGSTVLTARRAGTRLRSPSTPSASIRHDLLPDRLADWPPPWLLGARLPGDHPQAVDGEWKRLPVRLGYATISVAMAGDDAGGDR